MPDRKKRRKAAIKLAWPRGTPVLIRRDDLDNGAGGIATTVFGDIVYGKTAGEPKLDGMVRISYRAYRKDVQRVGVVSKMAHVHDLTRATVEAIKAAVERGELIDTEQGKDYNEQSSPDLGETETSE